MRDLHFNRYPVWALKQVKGNHQKHGLYVAGFGVQPSPHH